MMLEIGMMPNPLEIGRAQIGPLGYADDLANFFANFREKEELERESEREKGSDSDEEEGEQSQANFWGLPREPGESRESPLPMRKVPQTPGAKKLVSLNDLHEHAAAPVLRAYIATENHRREFLERTPMNIENLKEKKKM